MSIRAARLRDRNRRPTRLHLENLEDRLLLSVKVIEDFSSGNLNNYWTEYRYAPSASIVPGATHDGTGYGLDKADGFEWILRSDDAVQVQQGETLSVWTQFAGAVDGRIYFGFGSKPEGLVHSPLSDGHTLALVLAGNTNQMMFMGNDTSQGFKPAPHVLGTAVAQTYNPDQWYRMEVVWGTDGTLTGNLYDSDGVTKLNTVTTSETAITSGGIAFRGFGSDKYFDTVTVDTGNGGAAQYRNPRVSHNRLPSHTPPTSPPPDVAGDTTGTPVPWDYTSVPGSNRDVTLGEFDQLTQISGTYGLGVDGQTKVGLAAQNISCVVGPNAASPCTPGPASNQILWGPNSYGGTGDVIVETPYLAQYLFRELPGQPTYLIGSSDVKHFFSSAKSDYQHLNPSEQDVYVSSLNMDQNDFLPGADLNSGTGEIHNFNDFGPLDNDGFNRSMTRHYSSRLEHMLQVNIADLDPAQNPSGTRWFLAGNLWVAGDEDVTNNSRWVEVVPHFDNTTNTFSFSYPNGATGQYNFRTIPNLVQGPTVLAETRAYPAGEVDTIRVRFNVPINETTFTPDQVGLQGPDGKVAAKTVTPVDGSNDELFDVSFNPQSALGYYMLTVGPNIQDQQGNSMRTPYQAQFANQGPQVIASTPASAAVLPAPVDTIRLSFNEPMDPKTFTPDKVDLFLGPKGRIPVTAVTPVADSNNTQFDISFDPQGIMGQYTLVIGPDIYDLYGNALDQNNNFVPGEIPGDLYTVQFNIRGPQITAFSPTGTASAPVDHVRVTFDAAIDENTFTTDQVTSFIGPDGSAIPVTSVQVVSDTGSTQFDIGFDALTDPGIYTITIGPDIQDIYGNSMPAAYTASFSLQGPFYNMALRRHYQPFEIYGHGGVPVPFQDGTFFTDDDYGTIDLGSDTFNFASTIYTGARQLFVSSNGLITFGSGNSSPSNANLANTPTQAAIAPLWSDWLKTDDGTGPMILAKFATNQKGERRLIIEWNKVRHYNGNSHLVTFQAILTLDTGSTPGDIIFNYVDITTGDRYSDGLLATIGVKDPGNQGGMGGRRLLFSYNPMNPPVTSRKALLITYAAAAPGTSESGDGLPFASESTVGLASLTVAAPGLRPNQLPLSSLMRHAQTAEPALALAALDQLFASTQKRDSLASEITLRLGKPIADGLDPLMAPLDGQAI